MGGVEDQPSSFSHGTAAAVDNASPVFGAPPKLDSLQHSEAAIAVHGEWEMHLNEDNIVYYFNSRTGESSWSCPSDWPDLAPRSLSSVSVSDDMRS
jgi:hypothetical protein